MGRPLVTVTSGLLPVTLRTLHDWWSPLIRMIIGFLFTWGVFELTEQRRRKRAQAGVRRALVAELGQAELVLSAIVFNLSIGTDHLADASFDGSSSSGPSAFCARESSISQPRR